MIRKRLGKFLLLAALSVAVSACATSIKAGQGVISRLKNRGPVALSADNPYLAANVLLSKEMEGSPELEGFIKKRGIPSALEVKHEMFGALLMQLYYLGERQTYVLEDADGMWLIRGPEPFSPETLRQVTSVAAFRADNGAVPMPAVQTLSPNSSPAHMPAATPFPAPQPSEPRGFQSPARAGPAEKLDDRQLVSRLIQNRQKELAEVSPRGDIVHYVTSPLETLSILSRWYTLDAANLGKIARINQIKAETPLSLGDSIVIPSYLVRNKVRLTERDIQALQQ